MSEPSGSRHKGRNRSVPESVVYTQKGNSVSVTHTLVYLNCPPEVESQDGANGRGCAFPVVEVLIRSARSAVRPHQGVLLEPGEEPTRSNPRISGERFALGGHRTR